MQIGIIGLAQSGKTTLFEALTRNDQAKSRRNEVQVGVTDVPDLRVDRLSEMYKPKKTTYAKIQYVLPARALSDKEKDQAALVTAVRSADALIMVVKNFAAPGGEPPAPKKDIADLDSELVLTDLIAVEKKLERMEHEAKRGKKADPEEMELLKRCHEALNADQALRHHPDLCSPPKLRGYAFLSAKPLLIVVNNDEADAILPDLGEIPQKEAVLAVRCRLEQEISQMEPEDAAAFLSEYGLAETAMNLMIRRSYELLGLMSFFTVGEDEVRAWTIRCGTPALEAAGAVHSDIQRGFIRAEVLAYDDLISAGSYAEARKRATVRLEGKTYEVKDGDIAHFRFNI
ncbi:MAG: redox-regulated ATPase YchF [Deltaproteobacteria bacterium]|nr:redox-regulated ATPase YchF [Deltaproteobacteria bacterium]